MLLISNTCFHAGFITFRKSRFFYVIFNYTELINSSFLEKITSKQRKKGDSIMNCRNYFFTGTLCLHLIYHGIASAEMVSIKGEDINMRSGPGTNNSILYTLGSGMPLEVIKRSDDWMQIRDFEGEVGWVHQNTVSNTPMVIIKANKNSTAQINIRSGPGPKNKIIARALYGVVFRKIGEKDQWVEIEHEQGVKGWVDRSLLWGL